MELCTTYKVKKGDSLYDISVKFKDKCNAPTWQQIAEFNGISDPYTVQPGQELKIPKG